MPPVVAFLENRLAAFAAEPRSAGRPLLAAIHLAALGVMLWSETQPVAMVAFVLTWGFLNCFWLVLLRRPVTSAALSLALIVILILLSQFKHSILMMTITFVDVMIIDVGTFSFLLTIIPGLAWKVGLVVLLAVPVLLLLWRLEPFRMRRGPAFAGAALMLRRPGGAVVHGPDRPRGRIPPEQVRFQVRPIVGGCDVRSADPRRLRGRCRGARPAEPGRGQTVRAGRQAAAYRHGVRRIELRHHHDAGHQGSAELPGALPLL
jgi:hypothetical protein